MFVFFDIASFFSSVLECLRLGSHTILLPSGREVRSYGGGVVELEVNDSSIHTLPRETKLVKLISFVTQFGEISEFHFLFSSSVSQLMVRV